MRAEKGKLLESLSTLGCRPIIVASHPRSGTHLTIDTLRLNFPQCRSWKLPFERADRLYLNIDDHALEHTLRLGLTEKVFRRVERPLVKTHARALLKEVPAYWGNQSSPFDPDIRAWLIEHGSFVYVYRDGREVMRSMHQFVSPRQGPEPGTFGQFLRQRVGGVSRARLWAQHVEEWLANPHTCCISMEGVLTQKRSTVATIARETDLPWEEREPALPTRCDTEFVNRLRRRAAAFPSSTAICTPQSASSNQRWDEVFTASDREFFHEEAGSMLIRLGYERSDRWVTPSTAAHGDSPFRSDIAQATVGFARR